MFSKSCTVRGLRETLFIVTLPFFVQHVGGQKVDEDIVEVEMT
jgi:hypothetical protein